MIEPQEKVNSQNSVDASSEFQTWTLLIKRATEYGSDLIQLLLLELRLAVADSGRLFILMLLFVPILILTWVSLGLFLSWLIYLFSSSVTLALFTFFIIQFISLIGIIVGGSYYKKSLSLPLTRQHINRLVKGDENDT
jgi:hypothetical protein